MRRVLLVLLLAACVHEAPAPLPAAAPDQPANALKDRAEKALAAHEYGQAYALFNEAYALEPLPATAVSIATAAAKLGQADNAFEWLHTAIDNGFTAVSWLKDPDLASLRADPRWARLPGRIKPRALALAKELDVGGGLERTTPQQAGIDPAALQALLTRAEATRSSALVVLRDGKLVGDWYFGGWTRPIDTLDITESVLALAVGFLLDFWNQLAPIGDKRALLAALGAHGLKHDATGLRSIEARGARGQYLIIFPTERLIVVRLSDDDEAETFDDLGALAAKITTKN